MERNQSSITKELYLDFCKKQPEAVMEFIELTRAETVALALYYTQDLATAEEIASEVYATLMVTKTAFKSEVKIKEKINTLVQKIAKRYCKILDITFSKPPKKRDVERLIEQISQESEKDEGQLDGEGAQ